jgi:hypothetical protein
MNASTASQYELLFRALCHGGRTFAFRCDASGEVDLDRLSAMERNNYLYARVFIGREFARPSVELADQS